MQNPVLTHYSPPLPPPAKKSVSASIKRLILELGLRYRPSATDQLDGYEAKLAALMMDCADIPPQHLDRAIRAWVTQSPYLPKASDLIGMAQRYVEAPHIGNLQELADRYNQAMSPEGRAKGLSWIVEGGNLKLDEGQTVPRFGREVRATQDEIDAYAKKQQASKRAAKPQN